MESDRVLVFRQASLHVQYHVISSLISCVLPLQGPDLNLQSIDSQTMVTLSVHIELILSRRLSQTYVPMTRCQAWRWQRKRILILSINMTEQASGLLHLLTSGLKHCRISWGGSISLQCPVGGRGGKFRPASPQLVFMITVDRGGGGRCAEPGKSRAQSGILFMQTVEYHSCTI